MCDQLIKEMLQEGVLKVDAISGDVFSINSNTPNKPLGAKTSKGYLRTCLNFKGIQRYVMIHRVVCVSAHGLPPSPRLHVNHKNGIKTDNRPENLEWVSHIENMRHAKRLGFYAGVGRRDGIRDKDGRFGKKAAGRLLKGREHNEFPEAK